LGTLDELHVVEEGARIVAHAFLFGLEVWFGGRPVKAGGIASVGVAPEARGRGVGAFLLERLHDVSHARGDAITVLFPFRQGYYARLGYAPTTPSRRLSLCPRAVPRDWLPKEGLVLRAAQGADREGIEALYLRACTRTTGWITRPPALWNTRLLDERRRWFVLAREGGGLAGYVSWTIAQEEAHGRTTITVHDLVADDDERRRPLWGLLGAQRDQADEVLVNVDAHDPIGSALVDADRERFGTSEVAHTLGTIVGGPMVHLQDIPRALAARGYACDATLELDVSGERFHLRVDAGTATTGPSRASNPITVDRTALTAVAFGAMSPSDAARLGWLHPPDAGTLRAADALFALAPYNALDTF
jgi:predicted acetyltransferase